MSDRPKDDVERLDSRLAEIEEEMGRADPRFVSPAVKEIVELGRAILARLREPCPECHGRGMEEGEVREEGVESWAVPCPSCGRAEPSELKRCQWHHGCESTDTLLYQWLIPGGLEVGHFCRAHAPILQKRSPAPPAGERVEALNVDEEVGRLAPLVMEMLGAWNGIKPDGEGRFVLDREDLEEVLQVVVMDLRAPTTEEGEDG